MPTFTSRYVYINLSHVFFYRGTLIALHPSMLKKVTLDFGLKDGIFVFTSHCVLVSVCVKSLLKPSSQPHFTSHFVWIKGIHGDYKRGQIVLTSHYVHIKYNSC